MLSGSDNAECRDKKMATSNFYLYDSRCSRRTLIILHFRYNSHKLVFSTRQKALPKHWNQNRQRLKETSSCPEAKSINQILNKIELDIHTIYHDLILSDITPSNSELSTRLKSKMKIDLSHVKTPQDAEVGFMEILSGFVYNSVQVQERKIR